MDMAAAPYCSYTWAIARGSKSLRIMPREGDAFFISAIMDISSIYWPYGALVSLRRLDPYGTYGRKTHSSHSAHRIWRIRSHQCSLEISGWRQIFGFFLKLPQGNQKFFFSYFTSFIARISSSMALYCPFDAFTQ